MFSNKKKDNRRKALSSLDKSMRMISLIVKSIGVNEDINIHKKAYKSLLKKTVNLLGNVKELYD